MDESATNELINKLDTLQLIALKDAIQEELVNNRRYLEYLYYKDRIVFKIADSNTYAPSDDYNKVLEAVDRQRQEISKYPLLGANTHDPWRLIFAVDKDVAEENRKIMNLMNDAELRKFESILLR